MCNVDQQTMDLIAEIVDGFVSSGRMFTAFEVSLAVNERRKGLQLPWVRHTEMKQDVHDYVGGYVSQGAYCQNLQNVGAPMAAFVYYPQGADPSQYRPLPRPGQSQSPAPQSTQPAGLVPDPSLKNILSALANSTGSPITATNLAGQSVTVAPSPTLPSISMGSAPAPASATDDNDPTTSDKFGRLNVPAQLVREAGMAPGDEAYVYQDQVSGKPCLVVTKGANYNGQQVTKYTVEPRFGVKIRPGIIERAGLGKGPYEFAGTSTQIRVSAK